MTRFTACSKNDEFVELTQAEYEKALYYGDLIWRESQQRGYEDQVSISGDMAHRRHLQQVGVMAQLAVAKALEITWSYQPNNTRVNGPKRPDLPHNIEVRTIGVDHYGLKIRIDDPPDLRVVGIVIPKGSEQGTYRIPGWINAQYGQDAKKRPLLDPGGRGQPFHPVLQEDLFHLNEIRKKIGKPLVAVKPNGK